MNVNTMTENGLRRKLLALLQDNPSCQTVLRDWEWYLGREIISSDFSTSGLEDYLRALASELTPEQILTVQVILNTAWDVGHGAGLIESPPPT